MQAASIITILMRCIDQFRDYSPRSTEKRTIMKKTSKVLVPILAVASIIAGCGSNTTKSGVDTSGTITKADTPSDASTSVTISAKEDSANTEESISADASSSASTTASTEELVVDYDASLPTVVFLGDDQFDLGRADNTSIAYYVETLLGTEANVINLGCNGVTASTAIGVDNDTSMNFVNTAKFLNGEMDDTFFNNFPEAKKEAFLFDPADVDYYVIEYGINDFLQSKALVNDDKKSDTTCYINAMTVGLNLLTQASPNAKIILCSPVYSMFYAEDGSNLGSGHVYSNAFGKYMDYCAGCTQLNSIFNSIGFDAFGDAYMNINDQTFSDYMEEDGIHLTRAGRNTFAAVVAHMINKQLGLDDTEFEESYKIRDYKIPGEE